MYSKFPGKMSIVLLLAVSSVSLSQGKGRVENESPRRGTALVQSINYTVSAPGLRLKNKLAAGSDCTAIKTKQLTVVGALPVVTTDRRHILNCDGYIPNATGGATGPIDTGNRGGQFFAYPRGRLYYTICSNFMDNINVKSFGFIDWQNDDGTQYHRVQLVTKKDFCFLPFDFSVIRDKLIVELTECKNGMHGKLDKKITMNYRWHGDKKGCGTFVLRK